MDEEDFMNDLGWNRESSESEETLADSDVNTVSKIKEEATPSTSQAIDSPQVEIAEGNVTVKHLKPKKYTNKAGRPLKSAYTNIIPTRESKRIKRCPNLMTYHRTYTRGERNKWCREDLATLLAGLEEFGQYNIKAIKKTLPQKSELDVKHQIKLWKDSTAKSLEKKMFPEKNGRSLNNKCANLDEWIDQFEGVASTSPTSSFALSHVFSFIAAYGKFPRPEQCNGIDFREMYHFQHCMMNGEPYNGMNPQTALELNYNISHAMAMIKDYNHVTNLQPHLYNLTQPPKAHLRNYGRQPCRRQTAQLKPELLMNLPHLNPLRIPPHMLVKPEIHCHYDSDENKITCMDVKKLDLEDSSYK